MSRWWDLAACLGEPLATFYAQRSEGLKDPYAKAREICAVCPVKAQCLDETLMTEAGGARFGFFGGMSPEERVGEARRRKADGTLVRPYRPGRAASCGTESGFNRHPYGEACDACKAAKASAVAARKGRDAYTARSPVGEFFGTVVTIASRRELYADEVS